MRYMKMWIKGSVEVTFLMFHGPISKFLHRFWLFMSLVFPASSIVFH